MIAKRPDNFFGYWGYGSERELESLLDKLVARPLKKLSTNKIYDFFNGEERDNDLVWKVAYVGNSANFQAELGNNILSSIAAISEYCQSLLHRLRRATLMLKGAQNIHPRATNLGFANGLWVRSPFGDLAMAEWTFQLSGELCLQGNCEKYILKRAVENWLPSEIVLRQIKKTSNSQEFLLDRAMFQQWLDRWQTINGSIEKLLPAPQEQTALAIVNPDLTAYSFDRLIVCDRSFITQVLIANNFHFENNCAILSISGYPVSVLYLFTPTYLS